MNAPYDREPDERLADWVDGTMAERDRERFVAELRVSPQLRAQLAEYERSVALVRRALQEPSADAEQTAARVAERVLASLQAAPVRHASPWSAPRLLWGLAAAAALLAVFVWLDRWSVRTPREDVVADGPQAAPYVPPAVEKAPGELAGAAASEGAGAPSPEPDEGGATNKAAAEAPLRFAPPELQQADPDESAPVGEPKVATAEVVVPGAAAPGKSGATRGQREQSDGEAEKKESAFDSNAWNSAVGLGGGDSKDAKKAPGAKEGELSEREREQQRAETAKIEALSEETAGLAAGAEQSTKDAPSVTRTLEVPRVAPQPGALASQQPAGGVADAGPAQSGPGDTVPLAPGGQVLPQIVVRLPAPALAKSAADRSSDARERSRAAPHVSVESDGRAQDVALDEFLTRQLAAMVAAKGDDAGANPEADEQADVPAARRRQANRDKSADGAAGAPESESATRWTRAQVADGVRTGSDDFYLGARRTAEPSNPEQVWVIEGSPAAVQALLRELATQVADRRGELSRGEIAANAVVPAPDATRKAPAGPATGSNAPAAPSPSGPTTPGASGPTTPPRPGGGRGGAGPVAGGPVNSGPGGPAAAPRLRLVLRLQVLPQGEKR